MSIKEHLLHSIIFYIHRYQPVSMILIVLHLKKSIQKHSRDMSTEQRQILKNIGAKIFSVVKFIDAFYRLIFFELQLLSAQWNST